MSLNKILKSVILAGLFLIPFVVLLVPKDMFFLYVVGKNFAFRVIVEMIFAVWVLLALTYKEYRPRISPIFLAVFLFTIIVGLADIFGVNPYKSLWSNYERMDGFVTLLHLVAYTLVWGTVLNTEKLRMWFWRITIFVSVIVSIDALWQLVSTSKTRLDSTLGNPIYLAVYVLFHIFIAIILAVGRRTSVSEKYVLGVVALLEMVVLYLTASRGAVLGFVGGMFIATAGIAITEKKNKKVKAIAIGAVLTVLLVVSGFIAVRNTSFVQDSQVLKRFANISLSHGTVMARTYVWGIALQGFKEHPMLGWGQENFNYVFNKYYDPRMYAQEQWFDHAHNVFLDWLVSAGVLGLLAYVAIFLALLYGIYRARGVTIVQKWLFVGLIAAYAFHNLTVFDNITSYILIFAIIAWIYQLSVDSYRLKLGTKLFDFALSEAWAKSAGVPVVLVIAITAVFAINAHAYTANKTLLNALTNIAYAKSSARAGKFELAKQHAQNALFEFKKADDLHTFGSAEIRGHLSLQIRSLYRQPWLPQELKDAYFDLSKKLLVDQRKIDPENPRFALYLAGLYSAKGDYESEARELESARALSSTKQTTIFAQGINAIRRKKNDEAIEFFKEAYELDKHFAKALNMYIQALAHGDQRDRAEEVIKEFRKINNIPD